MSEAIVIIGATGFVGSFRGRFFLSLKAPLAPVRPAEANSAMFSSRSSRTMCLDKEDRLLDAGTKGVGPRWSPSIRRHDTG